MGAPRPAPPAAATPAAPARSGPALRAGAALFLAAAMLPAPSRAGEAAPGGGADDPVLAEIGGRRLTRTDLLLHLRQVDPRIEPERLPEGEARRHLDGLVDTRLFALLAREAGLDRLAEVRARIEYFVEGILAQELKDSVLRGIRVGDDEAEAFHRERRGRFRAPPRLLLQHVLHREAGGAAAVLERIRAGAGFEELRRAAREDRGILLAERRWFEPDDLPPPLAEAAFRLPVGGPAEVIGTPYGHHVLRVEESEPGRSRDLAEVRAEVDEQVRRGKAGERLRLMLQEARARHGVRLRPAKIFEEIP